MIKIIESPNELKGGIWYKMYAVNDEQEAEQEAQDKVAYLFRSKIINCLFLFVEAE